MRGRKQLRKYQDGGVGFIKRVQRCALFIDPGLGKTVITTTAFSELIDDFECGMCLIIAPPRVARKTWPDEFRDWAHTQDKSYVFIDGTAAQRTELLKRKACFHIVSIDNLPWLLRAIGGKAPDYREIKRLSEAGDEEGAAAANQWRPPSKMPYDAIIVDESSKVKSQSTGRWKALRRMMRMVKYFVLLTGTPASNTLEDLWAQIYLLDFGSRLGHNLEDFRKRWMKPPPNRKHQKKQIVVQRKYEMKDWAVKAVEDKIADITFTLREEDYADLPPRMYNTIELEFDKATQKLYNKFEREYILQVSDQLAIKALDGAAITGKLAQLANGVVYDAEKNEHAFHSLKLDALQELVDETGGKPMLVAYHFKSDLKRILERFPQAVLFKDNGTMQDAWNRGEIPMMLVHPQSAGYGLNLQFGGSVMVWYGPTWSLELYIQTNKRLHRSGQIETVMIHHFVIKGTVDVDMMAALASKNDMQEALLNALKQRIQKYAKE